ncbi:MAG TPA: hypothetical protein VN702_02910 [Acetobacteraceae bacterium]|nr:hypothetical protein [Acetobacteraceae bacterium]
MQNAARTCADQVIRDQLAVFQGLSRTLRLDTGEQRRLLHMTPEQWSDWLRFFQSGSRPTEPPVPDLLMRIGSAAHRLAAAESGQAAALNA